MVLAMRRVWDAIGMIIITAIAIKLIFDMLHPYILWIVIGILLWLMGGWAYAKHRRW